jgi:hypothetical protein
MLHRDCYFQVSLGLFLPGALDGEDQGCLSHFLGLKFVNHPAKISQAAGLRPRQAVLPQHLQDTLVVFRGEEIIAAAPPGGAG